MNRLLGGKQLLFVFLLFTFLSLLIFWPVFLGKVNLNVNLLVSFYELYGENLPFKNTGWDQLRIYFPFYKITRDAFLSGQIPLWNVYAFSGHPQMADFQSAVFYPLNIFALVLQQIEFWHLLRTTPTILGSFFTFLYLKNLKGIGGKKLSFLASLYGAISFGFSPFILTWGEEVVMSVHSIIWLPLILFAIDKYLEKSKSIFLVVLAIAAAFSFLGGYMQTTIYLFIFVFLYLLFKLKLSTFKLRGLLILGSFVLGAGLSAIQLIPSGELFFNSARSTVTLREMLFGFLLPPETALTFFAPDFFGHPATGNLFRVGGGQYYEAILFVGIAVLVFAAYAFFCLRNRFIWFLAIFFLISLSSAFDLPTAKLFLSLPIPFLSSSIANRILFLPAFCLVIMATFGFDYFLGSRDKRIYKIIAAIFVVYALILAWLAAIWVFGFSYYDHLTFTSPINLRVSLRNLVVPFGVFMMVAAAVFAPFKFRKHAAIFIILISFLHIFYFSQKYLTFNERKFVYPNTPEIEFLLENQGLFRSWVVGENDFENNFASQHGLFWPEGYDSLNNRAYGEFTFAMQGRNINGFVFRSDAGLGLYEKWGVFENLDRRKLVDMVGVKYVVVESLDFDYVESRNFKKVFEGPLNNEGRKFGVFENLQVLPRAFLASNYEGPPQLDLLEGLESLDEREIAEKRRKLIVSKLLSDSFDIRTSVVLEKPSPISAQFGDGSAEIVSYEPLKVSVKTKSDQPKILFLSDNYYPGWEARVDGEEREVMRANYTFRAVPLTAGEHKVEFYYDSFAFKVGLAVSLVSLVLLFVLFRVNLNIPKN